MQGIVDIGNSFFKIASFDKKELIQFETYPNQELKSINDLIQPFDHVIISSVIEKNRINHITTSDTILLLSQETKLPIQLNYQTPTTLGKDRIANAVAAKTQFLNQNVLVVDLGTCITYDLINSLGEFLGGAITPGIQMRLNAMNTFTGNLPLIKFSENSNFNVIGKSTNECMLSGTFNGVVSEIEGFFLKYKQLMPQLTVVLTGGDSIYMKNVDFSQKNSIFADQFFTLKGLNEILLYNL